MWKDKNRRSYVFNDADFNFIASSKSNDKKAIHVMSTKIDLSFIAQIHRTTYFYLEIRFSQ